MPDSLSFDGQVAVVTGGGGGLGRAYAIELARRGAKVVVNDLGGATDGTGRDAGAAEKVVSEIAALGGDAVADGASVATPEGGASICAHALDAFGRLDVVVSNAGILRDQSFTKLEWPNLDAVLDVHLRGAFYVLQPAFRHMKDHGGGRIVVATSASGIFGNFGQANYAAAKSALVGLVRTLAIEGAKYEIRVNAVSPVAATRLTGDIGDPVTTAALAPEQVAPLVAVLAHESCPSSGEVYLAGGGWFARARMLLAQGWTATGGPPTAEEILDRWGTISSLKDPLDPADAMAVGSLLFERIDAAS